MNTSNNNLTEYIKEKLDQLREFIAFNLRIILPITVVVIGVIIFSVALGANKKKANAQVAAEVADSTTEQITIENIDAQISTPEIPLELNAYADVNALINEYYTAMAEGDVAAISVMNNSVDDTEVIRIQETAKYIDSYQNISVYTKVGPSEGTYLAYVTSDVKFIDYELLVPGMQAYYICTDEYGNLYINDGNESSETVTKYIKDVSLQDDVVDLNNSIAVAYNDMLAENDNLAVFLADLTTEIDTSVGEQLALAEGTQTEEVDDEVDAEDTTENQTSITSEVVTTVKTTTTVNVRSSDSETADKLGKASAGQEFKLIEKRGNGWSEIEYDGKKAFIKTEFLEDAGTATIVTVEDNTEDTTQNDDTTQTANTSGKIKALDTVRIRAGASETADKLGTAYPGQEFELIKKQNDGWSKILYKGKEAYVKSEYFE